MPDYKYLEDGTPVKAEELNDRFNTLMGENTGVNELDPENLSLGALRHNQIPSLIGKMGETKEALEGGFAKQTARRFIRDASHADDGVVVAARTLTSSAPLEWTSLYRHTFNQPIERSGTTDIKDAHAIIVLANIHVNRFVERDTQIPAGYFKKAMRERSLGIAFRLVAEVEDVEDETGVGAGEMWDSPLPSSARGVSPGFTIDFNTDGADTVSGYPMVNDSASYDYMTFKDVALRSVWTFSDYPSVGRTNRVHAIRIDATLYGWGCTYVKARIDKINLTAIPLHTKVDKHGGS